MNSLRKLVRETIEEITENPQVSYLFHGTSDKHLDSIMAHGLKNPYLTDSLEKADYYSEVVSEEDGGDPIVLKVKVPAAANLRVDFPELDEPVSPDGDYNGAKKRIQNEYKKYIKKHPGSYDKKHGIINVDKHHYWVSLNATDSVQYEGIIAPEYISIDGISEDNLFEGHYTTWKKIKPISEDISELEDKEAEIISKLSKHFSIKRIASLGSGTQGVAYYIPNNRVLKLTTDRSEVAEAHKIQGKKLKHLSNIYGTYTLSGKYKGFYVIISELLDKSDDIDDAYNYLEIFFRSQFKYHMESIFSQYKSSPLSKEEVKEYIKKIKEFYKSDSNKLNLSIWFMTGMFGIIDELKKYKIQSTDWVVPNLGIKKDGNLAMYDFGYGDNLIPASVQDIHLNENKNQTEFLPIEDEKVKRHFKNNYSSAQFKAKNGETFYIAQIEYSLFRVYRIIENSGYEPIAYLYLHHNTQDNTFVPDAGAADAVNVKEPYRRIGIATALYDYAESRGFNIVPSKVQAGEIKKMWLKRNPEKLQEGNLVFVQPSTSMEYPDFFDGQANPIFNARAYPAARDLNNHPLSEDIIEERKRVSEKTVQYILNKMKAFDAHYIKSGGYGDAYESNGKIIKFTTDFKEAKLAQKFSRYKFKHIANIEKVVRYQESPDVWIYIITLEKLDPITESEVKTFRLYEKAVAAYDHYVHDSKSKESFEQVIKNIKAPQYTEFFDPWIVRDVYFFEKSVINIHNQIQELKKEVSQVMGASEVDKYLSDFHPGNVGKKSDGSLAFFDLRWEFKKPPTDLRTIKEVEISAEELNKKKLPYQYQDLFDDYVLEKTEAEIREIAPTLDLNQRPDLLIKTIQKEHPELFDNFADWLFSRGKR